MGRGGEGIYTQWIFYVFTNINANVQGCSVLIMLLYEITVHYWSNIRSCRKLLVCEIWTEEILEVSALGCHHCLGSFIKTLHWRPDFKSLGGFFVNCSNKISASKMITVVTLFSIFGHLISCMLSTKLIWRIRICTYVHNILHILKLWRRKSTKSLFSVRHILGNFEWACILSIKNSLRMRIHLLEGIKIVAFVLSVQQIRMKPLTPQFSRYAFYCSSSK